MVTLARLIVNHSPLRHADRLAAVEIGRLLGVSVEGELVTVGGAVVLIKAVHVFGSRGGVGDVAYEVARGGGGRARAERWACCWTARALLCYL